MTPRSIILAGASGDLGARILTSLVARGAAVRALLRPGAADSEAARLASLGATVVRVDPADTRALAAACDGGACVVSALNGLRDVIVDRQARLLDAAVQAGVPRFIPSDYAADFTRTIPGDNRNFDFRREFMALADRAPIRVTSILNGAFMDMLGAEMPIIQAGIHRVLYWGNADQPLDFTTKDNVAAYTAASAMDDDTPRFLRIAGESLTARQLAEVVSDVRGEPYRPLWVGSLGMLSLMIGIAKRMAPQPDSVFPPWQGMQYMRDMFSGRGQLRGLDTARYPGIAWTTVRELLASRRAA